MSAWKLWKSGFDRWERTTSEYLDQALRSPALLAPTGSVLKVVMHTKNATSKLVGRGWNVLGVPNREEQDVALHRINQLESQLLDLQEELRALRETE
tara:strand:- start:157 stop:447 length:291 start_codon:yes stop_codon:yes gene_type:complete